MRAAAPAAGIAIVIGIVWLGQLIYANSQPTSSPKSLAKTNDVGLFIGLFGALLGAIFAGVTWYLVDAYRKR